MATQETDEGDPVFAFPWIRSGFEGVCLSHCHWVGIREGLVRKSADLFYKLALWHELLGHWILADSTLPKAVRRHVLLMHVAIFALGEGKENIMYLDNNKVTFRQAITPLRVPLTSNAGSNILLERLWGDLEYFHLTASPVEEVWSVWASLREGETEGLISPRAKAGLVCKFKKKYGLDFARLYDEFDKVAKTMRSDDAVILATHAMNTPTPEQTLRDILYHVQFLHAEGESLDKADLDGLSRERVKNILRHTELEFFDSLNEIENIDFINEPKAWSIWAKLPDLPMFFRFNEQGLLFNVIHL
jgi:hypothetical protein